MFASAARASLLRRSTVLAASASSAATPIVSRRFLSVSNVARQASSNASPKNAPKSGSNWLTIAGLTALAATSAYYLFSPVEGAPVAKKAEPVKSAAVPEGDKKPEVIAVDESEQEKKRKALADTTVVFVLGGPGAGKGTQCANLVRDFGFVHLSAGDLLRAEQERPGSQYGELIKNYIKEGKIVPHIVTIALLENAMLESGQKRFLIDGFPRKMDQALEFERVVVPSKFILFFECPEEVMLKRLLKRGETSGRSDDNIESIRKRFRTFVDTSMPVIDHYASLNKVHTVSCTDTPENVYAKVKAIFNNLFHENK
ncbi:hypothetical protein BGW42_004973 [Actinomortierella wolfii]|nr:hypothetical protein BGW42_004973 [Actinomortierella wolfii]KAG0243261.1 hypothetical protein BGW41_002446 [Actinomortierella wolfii]